MKHYQKEINKRRTFGIISHPDAGKTTLTEKDEQIGLMEKIEAHEKALLHRAFSVFVFNDKKELMIQQRALSKYHSPGLWTNTCCSHQREGESNIEAGKRRLEEEMGFSTDLN